eukprot:2495219-Pyramimonas_sp.AAC.1
MEASMFSKPGSHIQRRAQAHSRYTEEGRPVFNVWLSPEAFSQYYREWTMADGCMDGGRLLLQIGVV